MYEKNEPLSKIQYDVMMKNFQEYMIVGGMPLIVKTFVILYRTFSFFIYIFYYLCYNHKHKGK